MQSTSYTYCNCREEPSVELQSLRAANHRLQQLVYEKDILIKTLQDKLADLKEELKTVYSSNRRFS